MAGLFYFYMNLDFILENRSNPATLIPLIYQEWQTFYQYKAFKEYYPQLHKVNDPTIRRKKEIVKDDPYSWDETAQKFTRTTTSYEEVTRISLALQKLLVSRKTAFTTGGKVTLQSKPKEDAEQELYDKVNTIWRDNKLQFRNADIFKRLASETEVAEIWYSKVNADKTISLKMNIYSPEMGYDLIPVYDDNRDLVSFGVAYKTKDGGKILKLYTADKLAEYRYSRGTTTGWELIDEVDLPYGKIPVIYYQINQSVWQDVQNMIERLELVLSNFGDTNDYNGSPILFAEGDIEGWADKGETGKVIIGKDGAKLSYVTWENAPESIKLEIETLIDLIYTITQTPNISFKEMKGMGDISGVAFDRIMIDAHLNATDYHNGVYGEGIQRRINLMKHMAASTESRLEPVVDLEITPSFSLFKIDDDKERIQTAMLATGGLPVFSQKDGIKYVGISDDVDTTLDEINNQQEIITNT